MPTGKGPLRIALEDFLQTNPLAEWLNKTFDLITTRLNQYADWWAKGFVERTVATIGATVPLFLMAWVYVLSGVEFSTGLVRSLAGELQLDDTSKLMAREFRRLFSAPEFKEFSEVIGSGITEPILAIFEQYASGPDEDASEFVRSFHGFLGGLTVAGGLADTIVETATGGQVEGAGRALMGIYWSLGLGFLGWQTLAPLLSAGLQPKLERHYNRLYRPKRFSAGELRDLYALGEIPRAFLEEEARALGWRDQDISRWIDLAFRNVSEGDVWRLFHKGVLSQEEVTRRLRALGFDPTDIPLLFLANPKSDTEEAISVTLSTARQAFGEQLISEAEFREALSALNRSEREIELQVQLIRRQVEQKIRALTVSQIRSAWENSVLADSEAEHWLTVEGFEAEGIGLLLRTWKAELAPKFSKLNRTTIVAAYTHGVLSRPQAAQKLQEVGLSPEDARLELDLAEARDPALFGLPAPRPSRTLTPGVLSDLVGVGIMLPAEMRTRLVEQGFSVGDAQALTQLAELDLQAGRRPLTQGILERAYIAGVLDRTRTGDRLASLGFGVEEVVTILDTVELENPAVFAPESVQAVRLPTIGALVEALRAGILTEGEYFAQAAELGYTPDGARLYLAIATRQERKGGKTLTPTQVANAYGASFIDRGDAMGRLTSQGLSDLDAGILLRFEKSGIEDTDVWRNMLAGLLSPQDALVQLYALGFTDAEIDEALKKLPGG